MVNMTSFDRSHGNKTSFKLHFVVDRIFEYHFDSREARCMYKVRWHAYAESDDTEERAQHLPQHFIALYWQLTHGNPTLPEAA